MSEERFDLWCMVELFGHNKIAGKCTEQNIAGVNMLRVDVPETEKQPSFTKFYNGTAIYAINPITEEVAKDIANKLSNAPITVYEVRNMIERNVLELKASKTPWEDE
jgi:hypothetical protein